MKKIKKSIAKKIGKKILQIIYLLLKPFIPYIIIFVMIFFFIILIIDAIFVSFSDEEGNLTVSESEIESYCESASTDNCDVYVDGEKTGEGVNISSEESAKAITAEQIYSLLLFHNIADNKEISSELAYEIANDFKSKFYYKKSTILTEKKITDEEGNITWEKVSEETVKLLTESITIAGHYKYNYIQEITEER